jgi:hypothetical protein
MENFDRVNGINEMFSWIWSIRNKLLGDVTAYGLDLSTTDPGFDQQSVQSRDY